MGIDLQSDDAEQRRSTEPNSDENNEFYVVLAVSVAAGDANRAAIDQLLSAGAMSASVLSTPRVLVLAEYLRKAPSRTAAIAASLGEITAACPGAQWVDVHDQDTLWSGLIDTETGNSPTDLQAQRYLRSTPPPRSPPPDALNDQLEEERCARLDAIEANIASAALVEPRMLSSQLPTEECRWVIARVVEVLEGFQLAHVVTADNELYGVTPSTPGIDDFRSIQLDQTYHCRVTRKFSRVIWAGRI